MSQPRGPQQPGYGDPREARAQASAEKAYRKAQRPWYKKKRFIFPLAIILLIVIISVANVGGDSKPSVSPSGSAGGQDSSGPPAFPGATSGDVVAQAGETVDADGLAVTTTPLKRGNDTLGETLCTTATYKKGTNSPATFNGGFDWKPRNRAGRSG